MHPVAVALKHSGLNAVFLRDGRPEAERKIARSKLHAVGFQNRRHRRFPRFQTAAAVVDVPQLHPRTEAFHLGGDVRAALGEPVAVKLEIHGGRVCLLKQNVVPAHPAADALQLAVVIVVQKLHAVLCERRPRPVEPRGEVTPRVGVAVREAVHARDDGIPRPEALRFGRYGSGIPLQTAEVCVQADDREAGVPHQTVPVQFAAVSRRHPCGARQHADHPARRMDHESAQFDAVVPRRFHRGKRLARLLLAVEDRAEHELLHALFHRSRHSANTSPGVMPFSLKLSTAIQYACPAMSVDSVTSFAP